MVDPGGGTSTRGSGGTLSFPGHVQSAFADMGLIKVLKHAAIRKNWCAQIKRKVNVVDPA
jgi:hypothetical protein